MIKANKADKHLIIDILRKAFDKNNSVNFVVKQDSKRYERIKSLMDYSFEVCYRFGEIYLSEDKKACALILYPDKQKATILLDMTLLLNCIGLSRAKKVLNRNSKIKQHYPTKAINYLWFIGVDSTQQGKGLGSSLLNDIIGASDSNNRPIYLETSMLQNLPFYKRLGFEIYKELNFGHTLYLLRRHVPTKE